MKYKLNSKKNTTKYSKKISKTKKKSTQYGGNNIIQQNIPEIDILNKKKVLNTLFRGTPQLVYHSIKYLKNKYGDKITTVLDNVHTQPLDFNNIGIIYKYNQSSRSLLFPSPYSKNYNDIITNCKTPSKQITIKRKKKSNKFGIKFNLSIKGLYISHINKRYINENGGNIGNLKIGDIIIKLNKVNLDIKYPEVKNYLKDFDKKFFNEWIDSNSQLKITLETRGTQDPFLHHNNLPKHLVNIIKSNNLNVCGLDNFIKYIEDLLKTTTTKKLEFLICTLLILNLSQIQCTHKYE